MTRMRDIRQQLSGLSAGARRMASPHLPVSAS
jgi:hypothetical protein